MWLAAGWPHRRPLARAARWDGVYLMTVHQRTGALLSPADIAEVAEAVAAARGNLDGFAIAFNAVRAADPAAARRQIREFAEAGGTWWVELAPDDDAGGLPAYRERIRHGPPLDP